MTDVEVFTGRGDARAATLERLAQPAGGAIATADLEGQFRIATAISNAVDAVPRGYRKQPGAVLLALAWATQHGLDILTTIQNVAFVEGRAVVDATMQRALAKRAGYSLRITVGADAATVVVNEGRTKLGSATYTLADAQLAGLSNKTNWKHNPEDMLVARATTRAIRRFAPDVLLGMLVDDEVDDAPELDALDAMAPPPPELVDGAAESEAENVPTDETPDPDASSPTAQGSGVESEERWPTVDAMRADLRAHGIKTAEVVREAQELAKSLGIPTPAGTLAAIHGHPNAEFRAGLEAWVSNYSPEELPFS